MSISLTITEQVEINRLQSCLLDTAQMVDVQRFHAVLSSLRKLIGAAQGFATYGLGHNPVFINDGVEPQIEDSIAKTFQRFDLDGNYLFSDPELQAVNQRRRQMGAGVRHESRVQMRELIERSRYFTEALAPAGPALITVDFPAVIGTIFYLRTDPTDADETALDAAFRLCIR